MVSACLSVAMPATSPSQATFSRLHSGDLLICVLHERSRGSVRYRGAPFAHIVITRSRAGTTSIHRSGLRRDRRRRGMPMRSFAEIDRAACRAKATVWVRPVVRAPFLRSPGQPLPGEISLAAQARFGHDFSGVRVHTERQAAASARRLGARAYALADQLVFDEGEYSPATAAGRELLRHELAHVAQWKAGGSPPPTGIVPVNTHDSPPEREAGRTATHDGAASPLQNPAVQCALKKPGKVPWGTYEIEMSDSGKGASYTHVEITFTPDAKGPVTDEIQFIQIAKPALPAKMFTAFHPDQADLEQYTTQADPTANVEGGYHVDIDPRGKNPRTKQSDPPV